MHGPAAPDEPAGAARRAYGLPPSTRATDAAVRGRGHRADPPARTHPGRTGRGGTADGGTPDSSLYREAARPAYATEGGRRTGRWADSTHTTGAATDRRRPAETADNPAVRRDGT
ncbi:hypothetical protein ACIBUR_29650 [Streptomyces anulatus]